MFVCVTVLETGLNNNFSDVKVSVADCPDLTQEPFKFPVKGKYRCTVSLYMSRCNRLFKQHLLLCIRYLWQTTYY